MRISAADRVELLSLINRFPRQRVVLLGDFVADEFIYGEITRVSREAPVLILKHRQNCVVPGGGANAANNLADLEAQVIPVGVVGNDASGVALLRYFQGKGITRQRILRQRGYATPTKSRILGSITHWQRQQIVRVDREPAQRLNAEIRRRLSEIVLPLLRQASALLISDYGYGAVDGHEADFLRRRATRAARLLPWIVDSRYDLLTYWQVTALTPNEPEVEQAFQQKIGNHPDLLSRLGRKLLQRQSLKALLVTRGRDGAVLFEPRRPPQPIPIFGSDQAVDVTGAGDTVIASFTLALAAGASFLHAAQIANCAAGVVVMKRGTATVTREELREAIRNW